MEEERVEVASDSLVATTSNGSALACCSVALGLRCASLELNLRRRYRRCCLRIACAGSGAASTELTELSSSVILSMAISLARSHCGVQALTVSGGTNGLCPSLENRQCTDTEHVATPSSFEGSVYM